MRSLEADVLHWQERYQESLRKAQSPGRLDLPISRSASQTTSPDRAGTGLDPGRGVIVAADESLPAEQDDLDGLIRSGACLCP